MYRPRFLFMMLLCGAVVVWSGVGWAADGVDSRAHWSFQPVVRPEVPVPVRGDWARHDIDRFILSSLEAAGMPPSPEADRATWLRRVSMDLTGLPPRPELVERFLHDAGEDAYARVVDELLASPRHGERWAQHWLDVVRYADTHGFEVNTERPNAWPYRDYVIRALNDDRPYDRFVREQIMGEALGEDAATGFLVTASVLLPGQIGKDEPSIRLARQDALDEIVVNISQTFLGLSVGCARCHDHKFDPISHRDYFAMQAFVAGVEYEDRDIRTPEAEAMRREAGPWRARVEAIGRELADFTPLARPLAAGRPQPVATANTESFAALEARWVRFTIDETLVHPTLGVIEPCLDELEIFSDEPVPRNLAAAAGVVVTASGSRTSDQHQLAHLTDGQYGNARSWMADTAGRGWVVVELPAPARISSVVWSRDRTGGFSDRLPTAFRLEAGRQPDDWQMLAATPPLRSAVTAKTNLDRFHPVKTQRLRFTIVATHNLEPCLDEIEVLDVGGRNVALASGGTTALSSGDTTEAGRHERRFIHDGEYGNSRSWMSNESGRGWIELQFPQEEEISRVVWGRDRDGVFNDRLATEYRIEVALPAGGWQVVADSGDRRSANPGAEAGSVFSTAGLTEVEAAAAGRLLEEKQALEAKIQAAESGPRAFAGQFRQPDRIRLLSRGDPEQPRDDVGPAIPKVLGTLELPVDAPEADRRRALADWLVSPQHPLTARVMVNRIWQGHFGAGLVRTPSDFGLMGLKPSHPELLDWLADEFMRSGWSMKHLHRLIVLSSTYRQSGRVGNFVAGGATGVDPGRSDAEVRWLWRFPSRRLEAEAIRDSMLEVGGRLQYVMYGRGFDLFDQRGGLSGFKPVESFTGEGLRRMIYAHKVRRERDAVFGAFDCPDGGQSAARRSDSTTPLQALNLLNSRFSLEAAEALAARSVREAGEDVDRQVERAWQLALGRRPTAEELADSVPVVREHGLAPLCRALFNSNEFLFLP